MKLDKIYIPQLKATALLEGKITETRKKTLPEPLIPLLKQPFISDTDRLYSPALRDLDYSAKSTMKRLLSSFRAKSLKTPTNFCLQHLMDFQQRKKAKNMANKLVKIDSLKRQLVSLDSKASNRFGDNLSKMSINSLIFRQNSRTVRKMIRTSEVGEQSERLSTNGNSVLGAQKHTKNVNCLRKKYAQLTFKEIMEIESDDQNQLQTGKVQKRRKVKTQLSQNSRN